MPSATLLSLHHHQSFTVTNILHCDQKEGQDHPDRSSVNSGERNHRHDQDSPDVDEHGNQNGRENGRELTRVFAEDGDVGVGVGLRLAPT
eukprot:COSAG01_NODE_14831_length_1405_cov_1.235069_1_plen_90_part_00